MMAIERSIYMNGKRKILHNETKYVQRFYDETKYVLVNKIETKNGGVLIPLGFWISGEKCYGTCRKLKP